METTPSSPSTPAQQPSLFKMPRVHKQEYWSFVDLVAPSEHLPEGKSHWSSSDATLAYCHKCKATFDYKSGTSASIRKHLSSEHPSVLTRVQGGMARSQATEMVESALTSKRKAGPPFLSPSKRGKKVKPAEEEMATRLVTDWIAKCLRPLSITEDKELRFLMTFVQTIQGIYELPSRRTITDRLKTHAQEKRLYVKVHIAENAIFFCFTTDIWTSRTTESFLALTIHFVTAVFDLVSYTLEVVSFPGKHTGVRIASLISSLMLKWELNTSRLTKIVRDNGANVVKACNELHVDHFGCVAHSLHLVVSGALAKTRDEVDVSISGEAGQNVAFSDVAEPEIGEEQWVEDPEAELQAIDELENALEEVTLEGSSGESDDESVESVNLETDDCLDEGLLDGCLSARAASQLMSAMKDAMGKTRKHVASFRKIVTFFNKSAKGKAKLKSLQKVPVPLTVIADVATRWNSTHHMLRRLLQLRPVIQDFLAFIRTSSGKEEFSDVKLLRPTGDMWFHVECLERLLVSFDGMTKLLSGEVYPTLPLVLPCLRLLEKRLSNKKIFSKLSRTHEGEPYYDATLKRMHLVRRLFLLLLRKRFKDLPVDVKSCSLLDPQFAHGNFLNAAEKEAAEQFLVNEAMRLSGADVFDVNPGSSFEENSDEEEDFASELLGHHRNPPEPEAPEDLSLRDQVNAEVELYFEKCKLREKTKNQIMARERASQSKLENALKWWKDNAGDFPFLAPVARKYFGIVATSVSSERCFSCSGNAITARRNRLSGSNVRDIIFIHNNSVEDDHHDDANT